MPAPALPARKAGGKRVGAATNTNKAAQQPATATGHEIIKLDDGTEVPIQIPAGFSPAQAQTLMAYLKANPEEAKKALAQAQNMLKSPGMAQSMLRMQQSPEAQAKHQQLLALMKDDPDFKHVFDDISANGPEAFAKYWDDNELMLKVSSKMRELNLQQGGGEVVEGQEAPKSAGRPKVISNLHDAAKYGDVDAARRLVEDEGADVNGKNERGISPLGIAVGFNKVELVKYLVSRSADVMIRDPKGNTPLHYAAGYGRRECAEALIEAGAQLDAENDQKQKPVDAAKVNHEVGLAHFLAKRMQPVAAPEEVAK